MKRFSDDKRQYVRQGLLDSGREHFARYGLKKTTMVDLTRPVDIAPSTFYQFFDSEEELYLEILEREGEEIAERVIAASLDAYDDPERAIATFLREIMDVIETNPLVRRIIVEDELDRLRAQFSDGELAAERERDVAYFLPYIEQWHDEGRIVGADPETAAHAIRAVTFLTLHEEDIGEDIYPVVRDVLIEAVAARLTTTGRDENELQ
jgi:AcrR family transcriptional regulator